jgi:hypothetical protein
MTPSGDHVIAAAFNGEGWEAIGCVDEGGPFLYCHYAWNGNQNDCLSGYPDNQGTDLTLENCKAEGSGKQYDQLWNFNGTPDTARGNMYLYGVQISDYLAACNGNDGDIVNLGTYDGDHNNFWNFDYIGT